MNDKQEVFIEEHVLQGHITPSFAIFKLKQPGIGSADKSDVGLSGEVTGTIIDCKAVQKKLEDALLNEPGTV
jgi:hypothetical protein